MPLAELRAGQKGIGKTVFSGNKVEDFQVEILGVLENLGPKQNVIIGKLSGGPLAETGVMQGMSGSPVYINGKLIGAVALAFPFAKEAIAGIRPIEEMLRVESGNSIGRADAMRVATPGESRLVEIATPVSFAGFTRGTLEEFTPMLRNLGLEPRQGVAGGNAQAAATPGPLQPGQMISVQLISGDLSVGADGTVTHIDASKIYAFGHRFLGLGNAEMPFARSEVIALLANVNTSFKITSSRQWLGAITADRNAAVSGEIGKRAATMPVKVTVSNRSLPAARQTYNMDMIRDKFLSPLLLQMAVFSAIDGTERTMGSATVRIKGRINMSSGPAVEIENQYAAEFGAPVLASLAAVLPLNFLLQANLPGWVPQSMEFDIEAEETRLFWQIDRFSARRTNYRPGETAEVDVVFRKEDGAQLARTISYRIPEGMPSGNLFFSLSDGATANGLENRLNFGMQPRNIEQAMKFLNAQRKNSSAWMRVWRPELSYDVSGESMPSVPSSLALLFSRVQQTQGTVQPGRPSKIAEFEIPLGEVLSSTSRTVQIEIKP